MATHTAVDFRVFLYLISSCGKGIKSQQLLNGREWKRKRNTAMYANDQLARWFVFILWDWPDPVFFFVCMKGVCCTVVSTDRRESCMCLKIHSVTVFCKGNYCIWLSVKRTVCNFPQACRDTNVKLVILTQIRACWTRRGCKIQITPP